MAFVRAKSFDSQDNNTTSFTGTLPSYETGDLLLWVVAKDSTAGDGPATPTGWTQLDSVADNGVRQAIFYKENVTGGSETNPQTSSSDSDTWTGVLLSIGGVPTSSVIEANNRTDMTSSAGECSFPGITTLTNNALVLHVMINGGIGGGAQDQGLTVVSDESGYAGESIYIFKEIVATAGASSSGKFLQSTATQATTAYSISIADGSSGSEIDHYKASGGLETLINGFQTQETASWLPAGFPSGITTDAFGAYGTIAGGGKLADRYQDAGDQGVNTFLSAASTRGDRNNYQGLRFEMDRSGGLATYDFTNKYFVCTLTAVNFKTHTQLGAYSSLGLGVILEDSAGNWKCWSVNGFDSSRQLFAVNKGPTFIDPSNNDTVASSGTLDVTDIQYFGTIVAGLAQNNVTNYISNVGIYDEFEITGGFSTNPINYDIIEDFWYGNLHRGVDSLGSSSSLVGTWKLGDGTDDTYVSISDKVINFPDYDGNGSCMVNDGAFGFRFDSTAGSTITFTDNVITCTNEWTWDQQNTLGTQTYTGNSFTKAKPLTVDAADYSNTTFTQCATVDQQGATLTNCTIDNSLDSIGIKLGSGSYSGLEVKNCTTGIEVDTAGSITFTDVTFSGNTTDLDFSTTGTLNIDIVGGDIPTTSTSGGGTINITQNVSVTAANLIDDTRVQLYNVTKASELDNSVVSGGSGYTYTADLQSAAIDDGDTLRLRATYQSGTTAKLEIQTSGVVTSAGLSFVNTQSDNTVYNDYGVDGSTITEFSWDNGSLEIDINDPDNTTVVQRIGAWYSYYITTSDGVANLFGGIDWETLNSIKVVTASIDLELENTKASPLTVTGGRLYRDDDATVIASASNSIQLDYSPVYVTQASTDGIADAVWQSVLVGESNPNGSAGEILENVPKVIARKSDL